VTEVVIPSRAQQLTASAPIAPDRRWSTVRAPTRTGRGAGARTRGCCRTDLHVEGDLELVARSCPATRSSAWSTRGRPRSLSATGSRRGCTTPTCGFCRRGEENLCVAADFTGGPPTADTPTTSRCRRRGPAASGTRRSRGGAAAVRGHRPSPCGAPRCNLGSVALLGSACRPTSRPGAAALGLRGGGDDAVKATASWRAGCVDGVREAPPEPCDRAVVLAPAGELVPVALATVRAGFR
jgi:propanol-preferring alcohol dehydrogenase